MKRNWKIIGAIVLFMAAWQYLVIKPYTAKIREQTKPAVATAQTENAKQTTTENTTAPLNPQSAEQSGPARGPLGNFVEYTLNKDVEFKIYANAVLAQFHLPNYQHHDDTKKDVVLLGDGIAWSSTNGAVQSCLNSLKPTDATHLSFAAVTMQGECRVSYELKEHKQTREIAPKLSLKGFAGAQGSIEFSTKDSSFFAKDKNGKVTLTSSQSQNPHRFMYVLDGSKDNTHGKDLLKIETLSGKVSWLSFGDKYFLTAFLPRGAFNPSIFHSFTENATEDLFTYGVRYPILSEGLSGTPYELTFYSGPRNTDVLVNIDPQLKSAIDLGWFEAVGRFMLWALNSLYKLVHNYGVAIILLTLIVRLLFWPLNKKMFESGHKMKALQPHMERIRAKYGKDKSRASEMNMEIMALYKTHKVNPMGSCLPMLLQIPVFFGLYVSISNSINLYQAPFAGWIVDLSSKDPYYVLPVLWTVSMYFTMKLNPQANQTQPGMPNMKYMMYAMYLVFGFISKDWPAGLNLYLVVSNLVGIFQQVMFLRASKKTELVQEGA
jgi:YidC/Oxa1 family membrane protein insertase